MPILHQMQVSENCYKCRLVTRQAGRTIALKNYPVHGGLTRTPEFLAKNPNGRVPLLEMDDGRCLAELGVIMAYLAEGSKLIPKDPWARAKMLEWMFFEQYSHEPYVAVARFVITYGTPEMQEKRRATIPDLHARGNAALGVMETHLSKHNWFAGGQYSIADIALYGYTHCAHEGGFDLKRFPAVSAWLKRVAAEPGHIPLAEAW